MKIVWGGIRKIGNTVISIFWCTVVSRIWKFPDFQKIEIWEDNIFLRCSHNFLYFLKYFGDKCGVWGSIVGLRVHKIQEHLRQISSFFISQLSENPQIQILDTTIHQHILIIMFLILGVFPKKQSSSFSVFYKHIQWTMFETPLFLQKRKISKSAWITNIFEKVWTICP